MPAALWLIRFLLLTLNVLMGVLFVMTTTESCGSVFEFRVGYALVGHVMVTSNVGDEFECQQKCIENKTCKSFNIHPGADNTKRICELNNKTRQIKLADLKKKKGFIYYGSVKSSCMDVPRDKREQTTSGHCHPEFKGKRCQTPKRGWNSRYPAHSCKDIRESGDSGGDGKYWIDPEKNGNPLNVYCDMTTDGGGWLLISNVVMDSSTPPSQLPKKTSYREISSEQMFLKESEINELRTYLSFTQLRFHCRKKKGHTFHVTTAANSSGEAVVQYFSGQTNVVPDSCGSFVRMENDNSRMAGVCEKWGSVAGKWGHKDVDQWKISNLVAYVSGAYHWLLYPGTPSRWECDDYKVGVSSGDFWKVFVR